tara:strand:+ start:399 stop:3401 length:3003 start_codon:yes stop_codon:yes gene_type:complete
MARVKINKLPPGYSVSNGKIVKSMQHGGFKTGVQRNYSLNTFPQYTPSGSNGDIPFFPSGGTINNTLKPVPRDEANLEAEKGETALTDLNNDGSFELYNIAGNRHSSGGTPLNLPEQSFIYSDTRSMKLNKGELKELGIDSKKRITPAKVSKKYDLNKFIGILDDPHADKISVDTAEYMLDKNKKKLSHLAFVQEAKKGFEEGVPKAAFPYLKMQGINPEEFAMKIDQANAQLAQAQQGLEAPISDIETKQVFNNFYQSTLPKPPQPIPPYGVRQGSTNPQGEGGIDGTPPPIGIPTAQQGGGFGSWLKSGFDKHKDTIQKYADYASYVPVIGKAAGMVSAGVDAYDAYNAYQAGDMDTYKAERNKALTTAAFSGTPGQYAKGAIKAGMKQVAPQLASKSAAHVTKTGIKDATKSTMPDGGYPETPQIPNTSTMNIAAYGGNPFEENPLKEFIYGGTPKYQGGNEVSSKKQRTDLIENWESEEWNDFRNEFYKKYAAQLGVDTLTTEQMAAVDQLFYEDTKQKNLLSEHYDEEYLSDEGWDTKYRRDADGNKIKGEDNKYVEEVNWKYNDTINDLKENHGYEGDAMTQDEIKQMQNFYITMDQMSRDSNYGDMLEGTTFQATGVQDETLGASQNISSDDGYYGNTYNRQSVSTLHETDECPDAAQKAADCAAAGKTWIPYNEEGTGCVCGDDIEDEVQEIEQKDPEFWLQDQLGIMNAVDNKFSLKKRYPIGMTYQENLIDPVFLDPTRQIAKIGEQAAIAASTASAFAGPQRAAAVQAKAQGVAADQIADAMANVDNQNAKIANDVSTKNAEIKMRTQQANKKELANLYDKTMLVEENYDNALRAANEKITQQLQNAYTNRAKTHNLNMTYPQFDIDPSTGGIIDITDPKAFYPNKESQKDLLEDQLDVLEKLDPYMDEGISDKVVSDILSQTTGEQTDSVSPYADIVANQSMYPGGLNTTPLTQTLPTQAYGSETPFLPIVRFGLERPKRKLVKRNTY